MPISICRQLSLAHASMPLMNSTALNEIILNFINYGKLQPSLNVFYCQTRDEATARLPTWLLYFQKIGLAKPTSFIVGAIMGELTNNAFDHNLGQWHKLPGCLVAFDLHNNALSIHIADSGQGIISSLKRLLPNQTANDILTQAFEKRISGRSPERRGNGLKFVSSHITQRGANLLCSSQGARYLIGKPNADENFLSQLPTNYGTYITINWSIT